jgi:hypothetical protein
MLIHLPLSVAYGLIGAWLVQRFDWIGALVIGASFGLAMYCLTANRNPARRALMKHVLIARCRRGARLRPGRRQTGKQGFGHAATQAGAQKPTAHP